MTQTLLAEDVLKNKNKRGQRGEEALTLDVNNFDHTLVIYGRKQQLESKKTQLRQQISFIFALILILKVKKKKKLSKTKLTKHLPKINNQTINSGIVSPC